MRVKLTISYVPKRLLETVAATLKEVCFSSTPASTTQLLDKDNAIILDTYLYLRNLGCTVELFVSP